MTVSSFTRPLGSPSAQPPTALASLGRGDPFFATDCDWLTAQFVSLYLHDQRGRITGRRAAGGSAAAPRFVLGRTRHGVLWRIRSDVPAPLAARLSRLAARERTPVGDTLRWPSPERLEDLRRLLDEAEPVVSRFRGPVFRLPAGAAALAALDPLADGVEWLDPASREARDALAEALPAVFGTISDAGACAPLVVSRDEAGRIAAICWAAAGDPARTVEARVETLPSLRRRGYAARALAGWLTAVRRLGGTPLLSASADDRAALGLARSLGLEAFADSACWS